MKVLNITTQVYFLLTVLLLAGCNNDEVIKDDQSDPDQPTKENTIAKYSLNFRDEVSSWTDEVPTNAHFWLHQVPTEIEGYYSIGMGMTHKSASPSQSSGVEFSMLISNTKLSTGTITPTTFSLVHPHTYSEVKDCLDSPNACLGVGTALVSGTEPADTGLPGVDNDIHAEAGTLTITDLIITKHEHGVIEGLASGHFTLNGINTNGSKPNPGSASGSFENAPFSTLAFE